MLGINEEGCSRVGKAGVALGLLALSLLRGEALHQELLLRPVVPPNAYKMVSRALFRHGKFVLLDAYNHRVLLTTGKGREELQIGWIGQDTGSLFQPFDLTIDEGDRLIILDNDGRRIQVFAWDGKWIRQITTKEVMSTLAVNSKGEALVSSPSTGHLVSVYDREGKRTRSFGRLRKPSELLGAQSAEDDDHHILAMNRVRIAVDRADFVYVAFEGAPWLEKYEPSGRLVYTRRIPSEGVVDTVSRNLRLLRKAPVTHAYPGDHASAAWIVSGIAVDPQNGNVLLSVLWDYCQIYVVNPAGNPVKILDVPNKQLLQKLFVADERGTVLAGVLSARLGAEVYEMALDAFR